MRALGASRTSLVPGGVLAGPWVRNDLWRRARAVPSLDLRFADNKSLVDAVTGASLVTFTRASSGTFVDSAGVLQTAATDAPRFDHNPTTGESLGLLVEEQRTNLLLRSEEFDNASWGVLNVTVSANTQVAPNGTTSAETITDVNGVTSANVGCFQSIVLADSTTYAMSCYVKAGTKTTCRVGIRDKAGTNILANFNLTAVSTTVGNAVSSTIQDAGNGWYRCTAICASLTGATSQRGLVFMDTGSYTADGTGTIHVWGAQLEAGAFPTSYIPTTTAAVTRSADVASITGSAFTSFYNQSEGTIFVEGATSSSTANSILVALDNGSSSERHRLLRIGATDSVQYSVTDAGSTQAAPGINSVFSGNTKAKLCGAYAINNFNLGFNGTLATPDTSGTLPTVDEMSIGAHLSGSYLNGHIRRLTYWPTRLADSTLQQLTQ